jgi:putative ABC transport system permease protein
LNPILKVGGSQNTADRSCGWFRSAFVVTDVALTMVLLICAGLALRSVYYLSHSSLDVDPAKLVVFEMQLPKTQYPNYSIQRTQFFEDLLTQIEALPGVEAAATSMFTPFSDRTMIPVTLPGGNTLPGKTTLWAGMSSISPGFFKALGLPLVQGRTFTSEDRKGAPEVAVVNETMARQFWPGEDPIGKKLANNVESATSWITVIGVVRDLRVGGVQSSHTPDLYLCSSQLPFYETLLVRTSTKPTRIIAQIQSLVRNLNKRVPADGICTLDRLLSDEMNDSRLLGQLLGVFSGMALLLTVVGIYGVISFTAAQRTHEFGLRLALGAQKSDVAMLVLNWGGRLALAGVLLGLGLAWGLTRLMAGLIEGVSPTDPATFASVAVLVVAVAMLSCWLPARRATNIDPMAALRCE